MKKAKVYSLPLMLFALALVLAGTAMAGTCTFVSPAASAVLSGASNTMNITHGTGIVNCTVTATSALSGGSWAVGTFVNSTNVTSNGTYSSLGNEDAADWVFSASCVNSTGSAIDTCTRTGLTVDNGVPSVASCTINGAAAASGAFGSSDATFACTVKNATACNAYWKTSTALAFSTSTVTRSDMQLAAMTFSSTYGASGTTATAYIKQIDDDAKNVYIACSDGTNTTTGTTYAVSVDGYNTAQQQMKINSLTKPASMINLPGESSGKQIMLFIVIGLAAVFLLIAAAVWHKKK